MASNEDVLKQATESNSKELADQQGTNKVSTLTNTTTATPSLDNPSIDQEPEEIREGFGNGIEFVLTCLGLAVGLGNVWRFPTKAYENGGSAFLIPYLTCAFLFGFPAIYFEFMLGQYNGKSPPIVFRRIMPFLEGVGWIGVAAAFLISIYYIVIVSWIAIYMFNILRGDFDVWNTCDNPWNTAETCVNMLRQKECRVPHPPGWNTTKNLPSAMIFINGTCQDAKLFEGKTMVGATEQYFMSHVIKSSEGLYDINGINWPVFVAMTICWFLTALGILKGARIMGKISYVSVLLPYFIVVVLFIRGVTLPGASKGLYYYFGKPDYSKLLMTRTWIEALIQLCYSLSVGNGGLISLASYSPKHNNVFRDALIIISGDTLMSLIGGAAVFSTLGFLAEQRGVDVPDVINSGFSLAFVVFPEAITQMPFPWLWSFLFFLMLFLLGASTEIALVDGAGLYWFEMFDEYAGGFSSVCAVVAELVVVMYVYGFKNVREDIIDMIGEPRNFFTKILGPSSWFWTVNWMIISPLLATFLMVLSLIREYPYMGKPDVYPILFDILGWFLAFLPVFLVPAFMLTNYIRFRRRGHTSRSVFMLQKQHVSYSRISKNFDEDKMALQEQLPDLEPWDEALIDDDFSF
uniref:Transporter n=1 Tax=Caenorhabditis tropicalis TaxID=1561998 RepID=A0A1I7UCD2_9PELO